jgi:3-oxoacyl-[acyl-carrier-protein] synthase-3
MLASIPAFIHGFGAQLPDRVVTNQEISARIGKTADWIEKACGIRERRYAAPETGVADLAVKAAQNCLAKTGASELGMIIVASGSANPGFPGPAAEVALQLGCAGVPALDLPVASAGSLFGMVLAGQMCQYQGDILVIGAEKMSAVLQIGSAPDPNTEILFGDGAGAVLISSRPGRWRVLDSSLHSDGSFRDSLSFDWSSPLKMNGLSVILQASRKLPAVIEELLTRQNIAASDVAAFLMHQANQNLIVRVAKAMGVAEDRFYSNIGRYGNTSSASMLIAAAEWAASNPASPSPIVFAAFGAGFHWGAMVAGDG